MVSISEDKARDGAVLYEIRYGGVTYCHSHMENCGYSPQTLREIIAAGFELYVNGKKVKRGKR